jgi:hypothetical protein
VVGCGTAGKEGSERRMMETIEDLMGCTITKITGAKKGSVGIFFTLVDGRVFGMFHEQDCCEIVQVEDICGVIDDLIGSPIVRAEAPSTKNEPKPSKEDLYDSWMWTFYILGSIKGTVTFRWLGESNGYYSEDVDTKWMR